jgi:hypothetical protein
MIQFSTLAVTLVNMGILVIMARQRVLAWRYAVLPMMLLAQLCAFYVYVMIVSRPPSETTTTWSAILRLQTLSALTIVLLAYWRTHRHG